VYPSIPASRCRLSWSSLFAFTLLVINFAVPPAKADVLSLDGSGDYVTFPATGIPSGSAPFTIEVWINPTTIPTGGQNGGQMTFWGNESANQANGFRLRGSTGVRHFFWANDHDENLTQDVLPDTSGPVSNGWHHFAITWDGTQTRWYWNGAPLGSPRTAAGVNVQAANHRIGARLGGEFFHGYMDELRIWNVARNAAAIAGDFQRELNGDETGLVAYWNFEGNLVDRAGSDNNGVAVDNAAVLAGLNAPVLPVGPRIYSFAASTNFIYLGQQVTLSWAVSNAASVVIDNGVGTVTPTNNIILSPNTTTTYILTATNANGVRTASLTVNVDPGVPAAFNFSTNTPYNTAVAITLRGSDPQGSNLIYSIVNPPAHGSLSGTPPNVTYTPSNDFGGLDSFTFKVNDGSFDSAPATVSINVIPPPLPPTGIVLSSTNIPSSAGPGSFVAALRAVDINIAYGDTHTFAFVTGGADNSQFTLNGNVLSTSPSFAGGPGATFSIRLKAIDSTGLSYTQTVALAVIDVVRTVVINEVHYNSPENTLREDFVELYNPTDAAVDVSLWHITGGINISVPENTILPANSFLVLAQDPATLQARYGITAVGPWTGSLDNDGEKVNLRDALDEVIDTVDFKSEFPWPITANGNGPSMQLVNPSLDNDLGSSWRSAMPTPGLTNSVFATNAAPNIRQVNHSPKRPVSTNQVAMTCKVTDPEGVASVSLQYQLVAPGNYIPSYFAPTVAELNANPARVPLPNPAYEAATNWTTVVMHDDGLNGDAEAGDDIYTATLPQQANRSLVRYRITCTDSLGASRRAPFEDDPSLNFAYFVYDGIPAYENVSSTVLQSLPVYFLLSRAVDVDVCLAYNGANQIAQFSSTNGSVANAARFVFNWPGTVVYDGEVYDHIRYRLRGANGRYQNGKRNWRIKFNEGRDFAAKDQNGTSYPRKWKSLNTGKGSSNRETLTFGLNEVLNCYLWNKVGVPAPFTHFFHFRVVDGAQEAPDRYGGDFWGLNWAQENYDSRFLETHGLPRGNLYKLINAARSPNVYEDMQLQRRVQAPFAVTNGADAVNIQLNVANNKTTPWLLAHINYTNWYRYHVVCEAARNYDFWPSANKNAAWYFEPSYGASNSYLGRMLTFPWDSDSSWGPSWNGGQDVVHNGIFNDTGVTGGTAGQNTELQLEYRNVAREMRDLLFQSNQIYSVIDGLAGPIRDFVPADLARWSNSPAQGNYVSLAMSGPALSGGLAGYVQDLKNFMFIGGTYAWWIDRQTVAVGGWVTRLDTLATDAEIPTRPTITYVGTNGFPVDGLTFQSSAFADPQGIGTFGSMQWRIAEVLASNVVVTNPSQVRLEWDAAWTSPEITTFGSTITFPEFVVQSGKIYRARVRHKDMTGRWSSWSLPVQFVPSPRDTASILRTNLVFNEIMYNPPGEGATDGDEFEFIELKNIGPFTLNLSGLFFSQGITFTFTNGTTLAPGAVFLVARNPAVLVTRYPGLVVNGDYSDKLNNDGETIAISHPTAGEIVSVAYDDRTPWPVAADGSGFSLVLDLVAGTYHASAARFGTPGMDDASYGPGSVVINEILSNSVWPEKDTIELLNTAVTNVDISGWFLTDDPIFPQKFRIPNQPPLAPGEFAVFTEDDFNPTPGLGTSFSLSSFGDEVYVFSADASAQLTGYSHGFGFGASAENMTLGRYINSVGEELFPALKFRTFGEPVVGGEKYGATNSVPFVGPFIINEIMYHPESGGDEFVELKAVGDNGGGDLIGMRLNGIGFTFSNSVTLSSNETLLLVATNPADFRTKYGVPAEIQILGPYTGSLQDSGEKLELQRPDPPTTNGIPWITIDEVRYNDRAPWPVAADGSGPSLQRIVTRDYANDPTNWVAAAATPGGHFTDGVAPVITLQPTSHATVMGSNSTFVVDFTGGVPMNIRWRFKGTNLPGETNVTLVLTNIQFSQTGLYSVVLFNSAGSAVSMNATQVVLAPVTFTIQPTNQNVQPGTNVMLVSAAVGTGTVRYQWRFEGTNIFNATNASYSFTNANISAHHGSFSVVAMDDISAAVSSNAFVYVMVKPAFVTNPISQTVLQGGTAIFTAYATGAPPIWYRWLRGGTPLMTNTTGVLVITNVQFPTNNVRVLATNVASGPAGVSMSPAAGVPLFILADADQDGMWDVWETNYFGNTNASPSADADGDTMINRDEYIAGTVPTNALSLLKIFMTATNPSVLQFEAQTNVGYAVQCRTNLDAAPWIILTNIAAQSSQVRTVTVNVVNPMPEGTRYYRIVTPSRP
jgi:hypothetical protein